MDFQAALGGGKGWAGAWYAARRVFWQMIGCVCFWAEPFTNPKMSSFLRGNDGISCFSGCLMGFTKVSGCLLFADVLHGNVVGEPDLVVA